MDTELLFLRKAKREALMDLTGAFKSNDLPLALEKVSNAVVIPPSDCWEGSGVCSDAGLHRFSSEADTSCELEYIDRASKSPRRNLSGTYLFGGRMNPHWGHFITDSLSRLWPMFQADAPKVDKIIFTLKPGDEARIKGNLEEVLRISGLMDRIMFTSEPIRVETLVVPAPGVVPRHHFSSMCKPLYDFIAASALRQLDNRQWPAKVYLSRSRLGKALLNEPGSEWIDKFFSDNGYHILYPEQTGFAETVGYIHNAEEVAAISGTLPHNLLFGRDGQKLLILEKSPTMNFYQPGVNLMRSLEVSYVDANAELWSVDPGLGPFILYPNSYVKAFAESRGMTLPDEWGDAQKKRALRKYIKAFRRHYGYSWPMQEWEEPEIGLMREAYRDTMQDFGRWISGRSPLFVCDLLSPRNFARHIYHLFFSHGKS